MAPAAPTLLAPALPALALPAPALPAPSPELQLREINAARPTAPRVRPEMLDACVVALRRMGGSELRSVGVTSSVSGEGRSTVAAAMAVIYASEYRRKTILIELDGHRSPAVRELGLAESPGVAELMRDNLDIDECIQWVTDDLGVVVAGVDPSLTTLLRGSAAEDIISTLSSRADMLVLDLPPLAKGAGGVQLVDLCESVALVVRAGVSTHQIEEAAAVLTAPPFVIMNGVKSAAPRWVRRLLGMR
jgi:protein-tyrosine kinase